MRDAKVDIVINMPGFLIRTLVIETEDWWHLHKARGEAGQIEASAARIRHLALRQCWRLVDEPAERGHLAPWEKR